MIFFKFAFTINTLLKRKLGILWLLFVLGISLYAQQQVVFPGITGKVLRDSINFYYKPINVLSYDTARDTLYGIIDIHRGYVQCLYTGDSIPITADSVVPPRTQASIMGYSTEHAYPQSMGASSGNPRSNLHHLLPVRQDVNSSRNNLPYMDIPDSLVSRWWRLNYSQTNIPDTLKEEYSKRGNNAFEVRDVAKGNVARAVFYFYTMYQNEAENANPDFFNTQLKYIRRWHYFDAPDSLEYIRSYRTAAVQNQMPNPFITDTTLVKRAYGIDPPNGFTLEILDSTHIKLKWTKNDSFDNVLIVRNQTGVIEDPTDGVPYQDGQTGLNGFIYVTHEDSLIDILPQQGIYFYKIYTITDSNTFSVGLLRFTATGFTDAIHYWNFNNNIPEQGQQWAHNIPSLSSNGILLHNFVDVQSFQGTLLNTQLNDGGGGSFCPRGFVNNDSCIFLVVPTTTFKDIVFSYATKATSTGYNQQSIYYSTNGVDYDSLTTYTASNFDWVVRAVDFSQILEVNDNPLFAIKIIVRGATTTLGNNRFDNFKITGNDIVQNNTTFQNYKDNFLIFPNPAKDFINIKPTNPATQKYTIEFYTLLGQKLLYIHRAADEVIDLKNFNEGIYLIRFTTENINLMKKLLIIK